MGIRKDICARPCEVGPVTSTARIATPWVIVPDRGRRSRGYRWLKLAYQVFQTICMLEQRREHLPPCMWVLKLCCDGALLVSWCMPEQSTRSQLARSGNCPFRERPREKSHAGNKPSIEGVAGVAKRPERLTTDVSSLRHGEPHPWERCQGLPRIGSCHFKCDPAIDVGSPRPAILSIKVHARDIIFTWDHVGVWNTWGTIRRQWCRFTSGTRLAIKEVNAG